MRSDLVRAMRHWLDVILEAKPEGQIAIRIPSSMAVVKKRREDVPYDSENRLYKLV